MEKQEQIKLASDLLNLPIGLVERDSGIIPTNGALYFSQGLDENGTPIKGGPSLIVGKDGTVLYANSAIDPETHLKEFENGRRTPLEQFNNRKATTDMARILNYSLHAQQLNIPILNEFQAAKLDNPQVILLATYGGFTEQVVSDGPLMQEETFEQRIDLVIKNTLTHLRGQGLEEPDKNHFYFKEYKNDNFNFKVYVQDLIIVSNNEKKVIRQVNAYFIEPRFKDFYQVSLSGGPFQMPTNILRLGTVDIVNDPVTKNLDMMMNAIMDNLRYKNK